MAADPVLTDEMRAALFGLPGYQEKKMFGGICWMVNGHLLCCTRGDRYMLRVGKENEAKWLQYPGVTPVEGPRKSMPGYIWVESAYATGPALETWVNRALAFVQLLPPK
ncbi:TfoX/Sxy family protein [Leeia oryzae]|uniref:TfoX/Sxy family protein n=1 Tax=Leeia oryzae TaxID=356662 RepID=UPI00037A432E|nr:TfoX/Sxy family protein [Leeia oryzae]